MPSPNNSSQPSLRDLSVINATPGLFSTHYATTCKYRPNGNGHSVFSLKPTAAVQCGPAATTPRLTTTSTTLTTICYSCSLTSTLRQPWLAGLSDVEVLPHSPWMSNIALPPDPEPPPFDAVLEPLLRQWKGTHTPNCSKCSWDRAVTLWQLQTLLCSTTPALSALSSNSLSPHRPHRSHSRASCHPQRVHCTALRQGRLT